METFLKTERRRRFDSPRRQSSAGPIDLVALRSLSRCTITGPEGSSPRTRLSVIHGCLMTVDRRRKVIPNCRQFDCRPAESSFQLSLSLDEGAVYIVQFEGRIGQRAGHSKSSERRSQRADYDVDIFPATTQDKAANHDIGAGPDKPAGAEVAKLRSGALDPSHTPRPIRRQSRHSCH